MWAKKKPSAYWKERKANLYLEDGVEEEAYFDGLVEFGYEKVTDVNETEGNRIVKTRNAKILTTYADLEFKHGDIIKVEYELYKIKRVDKKLEPKFESAVVMNPKARSRYELKTLTLE